MPFFAKSSIPIATHGVLPGPDAKFDAAVGPRDLHDGDNAPDREAIAELGFDGVHLLGDFLHELGPRVGLDSCVVVVCVCHDRPPFQNEQTSIMPPTGQDLRPRSAQLPYAGRVPRAPWRPATSLIAAAAVAVVLASCGSSSSAPSTATVTAPATVETPPETSASTPAATPAVSTPGCRHVPPPASRAGEPASKFTTLLDPAHSYTVRLATNCGPIVIQLAVAQAPKTTSSFAHLVQTGYYNDLTFHRIVPNFVIQGGDPNGNGSGGPSWEVVEPPPAGLQYTDGVVAMAKSPGTPSGTSGSQFFIVNAPNANLPAEYALVGHVVAGTAAVQAISRVPTEASSEGGAASKPRVPIVIERATLSVH